MFAAIACGVDGSLGSTRAAGVAARLARDLEAAAMLVHVDEDARGGVLRLRRGHLRRRLLRQTATHACFPDGTELSLRSGDPAAELLAAAWQGGAGLIVVSTGGRATVSPWLIGGTASALIRRAPCPVVVVPAAAVPPLDVDGLRTVVCVLESRPSDSGVLRLAAGLSDRLGGELHMAGEEEVKAVANAERAGLVVVAGPDDFGDSTADVPLSIALAGDGDVPVVVLPYAAACSS